MALVLSRNIGQLIIIGDREVTFTILGVNGNQVRIGIDADKSVPIHREEIFERIQQENKS